jgi:hypothetical protein
VDRDGVLRVVVSAKDWLYTAGHPAERSKGWTDCSAAPVPTVRKVAFVDVRRSLPADTPTVTVAQREEAVRNRRAQLQERPLW